MEFFRIFPQASSDYALGEVRAEFITPSPLPDGTTAIASQKTSLPFSIIDGASRECYVLLICNPLLKHLQNNRLKHQFD